MKKSFACCLVLELAGIHVWFGYQPTEAYYADCGKYLETLKKWLVGDGITGATASSRRFRDRAVPTS